MLDEIKGSYEREDVDDKKYFVTISVTKVEDIEKVYDHIKSDENFILVDGTEAKLIVTNPLSSKIENGEVDIIAQT